jgi:hypothetical protein
MSNRRAGAAAWTSVLVAMWLGGCGGGAALGEDCDAAGATDDECEEGGVCGDDGSGALVCLTMCVEHTDCASGQDCNGVEGTNIKGCRTAK